MFKITKPDELWKKKIQKKNTTGFSCLRVNNLDENWQDFLTFPLQKWPISYSNLTILNNIWLVFIRMDMEIFLES